MKYRDLEIGGKFVWDDRYLIKIGCVSVDLDSGDMRLIWNPDMEVSRVVITGIHKMEEICEDI